MPRSLIARRLGADFGRLHPESRERHGFSPDDGVYSVAVGTMDRVWHSSPLFAPFLRIGAMRNIMFPESGTEVPFRMESWAYRDRHGRETLSLNRTFEFDVTRRFDEYLVEVDPGSPLLIYVGSHQHLAARIDAAVTERGGLVFTTGAQRLFTRRFSVPFPMTFSATARVEEWFDDSTGRFHIDARVRNRVFGAVFACTGSFDARLETVPESGLPPHVRPVFEQART